MFWLFRITEKLCVPTAVLGIIIYYATDFSAILYVCAGWLVLHSLLNCIYGGQNNLVTEVMTFFVGAIIVWIFKIDFWQCIAVAFCYAEILFTIPGIVLLASAMLSRKKEK